MSAVPPAPIMAFCVAGGHPGERVIQPGQLTDGWQVQRASIMTVLGQRIWYADEASSAAIVTCPEHRLEPEGAVHG